MIGSFEEAAMLIVVGMIVTGVFVSLVHHSKLKIQHWHVLDGETDRALDETDEGKLFKIVGVKNTCPDCKQRGFYGGPSGGMSTNIFCTNRECRSGFNITYFDSRNGTCERIHQGDIASYPQQ